MKKLRLKREWCFMMGVVVGVLSLALLTKAVDFYIDALHACDQEKGYTCNIFGK